MLGERASERVCACEEVTGIKWAGGGGGGGEKRPHRKEEEEEVKRRGAVKPG